MPNLPQTLKNAISSNNLIPFVGTGVSMGVKDVNNQSVFKSWTASLFQAVDILNNEQKDKEAKYIESALAICNSSDKYLSIASEIKEYLHSQWNPYLTKTFDVDYSSIDQGSLKIAQEILKIHPFVITTNYDNVLKWACSDQNNLVEWDKKALYGQVESLKQTPAKQTIWYLHGKISNPDDIVFTKESYEKTYAQNSGAIEVLKTHLLTKSFLFCGFSLDDPYLKMQLEKLKTIFGNNLSKHFIILKKGQSKDFTSLGDIQCIEVDNYDEAYLQLLKEINALKTNPSEPDTATSISSVPSPSKQPFFNVPFVSKQEGFVGMEGKLEEIYTKLNTSNKLGIGQVAKFEGMGGLGKTQLAVEYAHRYKEHYANGVVWLTMDQNLDEQLLIFGKSYALVNQYLDVKDQLQIIKNYVRTLENVLLIYDNVNVKSDIEQDFFPKSSTNQILITTRNAIQGYTSIELQTLDFENSKKLLMVESGKTISHEDEPYVKTLCEKLDGLPLALEMAGAYVKYMNLSWQAYLALYEKQNIALLEKSELTESFTNHENNIAKTLTISQDVIQKEPKLREILQLLSYGAHEPIDDVLMATLLACEYVDIIEAISLGVKLKYIKHSSEGYSIHRLLKEVWKSQNKLESDFAESVAKQLAAYIFTIKDEFLNLSKIEKANLFSEQWIDYVEKSNTKAILLAYRAYNDYYKGSYEKGLDIVKQAESIVEKDDSKVYAEILIYMGRLNRELGNSKDAKEFYEQAYEMRKRLYPNQDHPDIANSLNNLGSAWEFLGESLKAKDFYEQAYEMEKRLYSNQDHPTLATFLNNLGSVLESLGESLKAKDFYEQAYEMRKRLYPNQDHPDIATFLNNLGFVWESLGEPLKAKDFYEQAYEMRKRLYSNQDHPDIANSLNNLGSVWKYLGESLKAKEFYKQSFEMCKRLYALLSHPSIIITMFNLSKLLCINPMTRKEGITLLKEYKKIVRQDRDRERILRMLLEYDKAIGRDKSKRKKRK